MTTDEGFCFKAADGVDVFASFSRTNTLPSRCSTFQHAIGSSAGARSASPVSRLKHA